MRKSIVAAVAALALVGCGSEDGYDARGPGWEPEPGAPWHGGERYPRVGENPFVETWEDPRATFGVDVDRASYALMRSDLRRGFLPHPDGVRIEEYLNTFSYGYEPPVDEPFSVHMEAAPSPFGTGLHLLRVGLQARTVADRGRANLVFLVDVSGSMDGPDRLPLVKTTLRMLLDELRPDDRVGLVVYAGAVGTVLEPTPASERQQILAAIDRLTPGGSTNGSGGIVAAYELAQRHLDRDGINRVILCTDGDFNVGLHGDALIELIQQKRRTGIYLTTLGFGRGNYDDEQMKRLAANGNGNYAFVDDEGEAARVVRRDLLATMVPVADDVKVQVTFDPTAVKRYRLLGYELRGIPDDSFENPEVDTGDVGAGHDVTALFELELVPETLDRADRVASLELRYKLPGTSHDRLLAARLEPGAIHPSFDEASPATRFAAAVAEYAEILRRSQFSEGARFDDIRAIATPLAGDDPDRLEFLQLLDLAAARWDAGR